MICCSSKNLIVSQIDLVILTPSQGYPRQRKALLLEWRATMHLTNKEPIRSDALAASDRPDAAGAPANEIEVTPEMIEEGCSILSHYRYDKSNDSEIVAKILAMAAKAR
jgi:hypothetical protein